MDQVIQRVKRALINLVENCMIHYLQLLIIIIFLITKTELFKEGRLWNQPLPTKLLAGPIRATVIFLSVIHKFPSFPDDNLKDILLIIYIQVSNCFMCIGHFRLICALSPEYCYEDYPVFPNDENVATQLIFFGFQVIITMNFVIAIWFIRSIRRVIKAAVIELIKFVNNDFYILIAVGNVVLVVTLIKVQDIFFAALVMFIIFKLVVDTFLVHPIIDFMALDLFMILDDYDVDDREVVRHPQANSARNGLQFRDALEPDN